MTDRLAEIKARAEAIIPGPWRWFGNTATDQVYLGTVDRGRLYIVDTHTRTTESVYHHSWVESYTLPQARENVVNFCGVHDGEDGVCSCAKIRDFLSGELSEEEGRRDLIGVDGYAYMSRGLHVHADLRFPDKARGGTVDIERRKRHGGGMVSYRQLPRYETLGTLEGGFFHDHRTIAEFEAATGKDAREALYREDFRSLDNPEATFIEHAAEDIPWLLAELERVKAEYDDVMESNYGTGEPQAKYMKDQADG